MAGSASAAWLAPPPAVQAGRIMQTIAPPAPVAAALRASGAQATREVVVQPGWTLSRIAQRAYGDAGRAMDIFEANRDRLKSPDKLVPGQRLRLP